MTQTTKQEPSSATTQALQGTQSQSSSTLEKEFKRLQETLAQQTAIGEKRREDGLKNETHLSEERKNMAEQQKPQQAFSGLKTTTQEQTGEKAEQFKKK